MKKSLFVGSTLVGLMMVSSSPALAEEADTTVVQPTPVVVQQQPAAPVVVNASNRDEGAPRAYPGVRWGGVALWGVAYSAAAITAAVADDVCDASSRMCISGRGVLWVPVVGPFIAIEGVKGTGSTTLKTLLAIDGAFQVGGVAMAVTGFVLSASSAAQHRQAKEPKLLVAPYVSQTSAGLGAVGHF